MGEIKRGYTEQGWGGNIGFSEIWNAKMRTENTTIKSVGFQVLLPHSVECPWTLADRLLKWF